MKTGNVTGTVYERSIHRKLGNKTEWLRGAAHGEDCAFFECSKMETAAAQGSVCTGADAAGYAVYSAVNRAMEGAVLRGMDAAGNGLRCSLQVQILLPLGEQERTLQQMVCSVRTAAESAGAAIADVKACVSAAVNAPATSASAHVWGTEAGEHAKDQGKRPFAGSQIVMTKWAGIEGTVRLTNRCREQLLKRYSAHFLEEAAALDRCLSIVPEAAAACKSGVGVVCAAGEGGIFHALWTLAEQTGTGLEVFLKKIPIRQETVEVCNLLDVNPYELAANGSLLCVAADGETLAGQLRSAGIAAEVIGRLTGENGRVIINGEERRFLEPAKEDPIYRILPV